MPDAPRLDDVHLTDLVDEEPSALVRGEIHEGIRIAGMLDAALTGSVFDSCAFEDIQLDGLDLRDCRLSTVRIARAIGASLDAPRSTWRDVSVEASRIGAAVLIGADCARVVVHGCRIDYVNLAGATLADVVFERSAIGELDVSGATACRVALSDCHVDHLIATNAALAHVDLRGCELRAITGLAHLRGVTVDETQLAALAPLLAAEIGIEVG